MNRTIYTYINLKNLGNTSYWNDIKHYPQITVTADLRKSLTGTKKKDQVDGLFKEDAAVQVWEFRKLMEIILPRWTDDETKFQETVILANFIRSQIALRGDDPDTRNWLVGCRRNLSAMLSSIILLEETNISLEDMEVFGDRNMELLLRAWSFLKNHHPAIDIFHERMTELEERSAWNPIFNALFGRSDITTLVFHGFYYVTPIQEWIMRLLENVGIRLIFLFAYDVRYPYANEIWRKTYSKENGYPLMSDWHMEQSTQKEPYGEIFEGRKAEVSNRISVKEYASLTEFVHGMKHTKEQGYFIYSPNANTANEILKDFYPEEYGDRKLLSYPIGQFVSILNQMWDEDEERIVLDESRLIECFSSGWLSADGVSGKPYLQDVVRILPFFSDCRGVEEWENRMELLLEIRESVIQPFMKNLDADDSAARWQAVMGNPFLNFSVFAVEEKRLDHILKLIRQLLSMAKELFGSNQVVRIQEHIGKLDEILMRYELSHELYAEERELVRELFEKLGDSSGFAAECFPADISSALNLYLSGSFQEGEIQSNRIGMVSPLYQIDAAIVKQHGKIHVCLCDVTNMPGGRKEYIWPLTGRQIRMCYERTKNPLIRNMQQVIEYDSICNRYFMYAALKNTDVQLSWISDMGDKLLAPSPYIRLVCELTGIQPEPAKQKNISWKHIEDLGYGHGRTKPYDVCHMPRNTAKEAKMDYAVCPMKYAFGYVTEQYPVFQSEFHQNYAINGLIAACYSLMKSKGVSVDEIYQNVIELFPAMRRIEKRQVYDYLQYDNSFVDVDFEGYSEWGDIRYSEERLKVRFPNRNVRKQALAEYGKLLTPDGQKGMDFYKTAVSRKADWNKDAYPEPNVAVCWFCQHQSYCRYAVYPTDAEAIYD